MSKIKHYYFDQNNGLCLEECEDAIGEDGMNFECRIGSISCGDCIYNAFHGTNTIKCIKRPEGKEQKV